MSDRLKKGYLQWRCRRGTKELDVVLNKFLNENYAALSSSELLEFDSLLDTQDTELWYWLSRQKTPTSRAMQNIIARINA
jgi:antitoxin CptB